MAQLITKAQVLLDISNMMGSRTLPQGDTTDWERFGQYAFEYAWRYYKWGFSLKTAVIPVADRLLPADMDLDGYISIPESENATFEQVTPEAYALQGVGNAYTWTTEFNQTTGRYTMVTSNTNDLTVVYQTLPPTLSENGVPFYSSMTIAEGAIVFAKQAENPTRAEVTQEWDAFHSMLNRHVGYSMRNRPKTPRGTYASRYGGYTGRVA